MYEFLSSLGISLLFAALTTLAAFVVSLVFILLRSGSVDAFLKAGIWRRFPAVPDLLASVFESIPLLILLILMGQTGAKEEYHHFWNYISRAVLLGVFMFPSLWRYIDGRLDLASEEVYPQQLMLWKVPCIKVSLRYVLLNNNLAGIFSSLIWVFTSAFTLDLSVGFLSRFGMERSYISWFDGSLGNYLGKLINPEELQSGLLPLAVSFLLIMLLHHFAQKLLPSLLPVYNRIKEDKVKDQRSLYSFREFRVTPQGLDIAIDPQHPLEIREGEFIWLNGPSGSGKSLFVKSVMQLVQLGADDSDILPAVPVIHCRAGKLSEATVLMPQEPDLYIFPYLSVADFLDCMIKQDLEQLAATIRASHPGDSQQSFLALLNVVKSLSGTQVRNLSAGEKRMVAFVVAMAQALQPDKNLIIFDEPDSSLDINAVNALKFYLGSVNNKSVIYITHNVMHSKDIHAAVSRLNIWQLTHRTDNPPKLDILNVDDVDGHYEQVHAKVAVTLGQIRSLFASREGSSGISGQPLLRINFPLTIKLGRGLRLKASLDGRPQISFTVRSGDGLIGIVGDNGIGKSSFLRAVIGLHPTQDASIALGIGSFRFSHSTHAAIHEHGICYVYDDIEKALPGNLPLIEVLKDLQGAYSKGIHNTQYIVSFSPEMLRRPLTRFSGGERQKIVFDLVCHVIDARLLLLDEPFSRLDWGENLIQVAQWLREKSRHCPVIIISHNREILEAMAPDNTWLLEAN